MIDHNGYEVAGPMADDLPQVTVSLTIENTYADGYEQTNYETDIQLPAPTEEDYGDELSDWADEHLHDLTGTGTGRDNVDAWYEVTITSSDEPKLVGRMFEWGG